MRRPTLMLQARVLCLSTLVACLWWGVGGAQEFPTFDPNTYKALNNADSGTTIAPGTTITMQNWQQYRQFMPVGIQMLLGGRFFWKAPPDFAMEVGPTIPFGLPSQYKTDTEKYAGQARLVRQPDGGYVLTNYMSGQPFPDPKEPNLGEKLFFNKWYSYFPFVVSGPDLGCAIDRYLNTFCIASNNYNYRLTHLSESGMPVNSPEASQASSVLIFNASETELVGPEQSKYITSLDLIPDDLSRPQELYSFLPALRRSLRLSSSARCAPLVGTDYIPDDVYGFNGQIAKFSVRYLGRKKLLTFVHEVTPPVPTGNYDLLGALRNWYYRPVMLPKPAAGKWELRDVYLLDIRPLDTPSNHNYCVPVRVLYYDAETGWPMDFDLYDTSLKLWKSHMEGDYPVRIPGTGGHIPAGPAANWPVIWDFQNSHEFFAAPQGDYMTANQDTGGPFTNPTRYMTPAGLDQIMQ